MFPIFPRLVESPVDSSSLSFCFGCQPRVGYGLVTCVVLEDIMDLIYLLKATPKSVWRLLASYAPKVDTTIGWWVLCTMRSFSFFLHFHDCGTPGKNRFLLYFGKIIPHWSFSTWPVSDIAERFSRNATVLIEMVLCNCVTMYNYSIHLVIVIGIVAYDTVNIIVTTVATLTIVSATTVAPFIYIFTSRFWPWCSQFLVDNSMYYSRNQFDSSNAACIFVYGYIFWSSPLPSNSHHHDYHIFEIGDPNLNLHVLLFLGRGTSQDIFGRHGMMMASIGCSHGQEKSSGIWQLKPAERPTAGKLTRDPGGKARGGFCG